MATIKTTFVLALLVFFTVADVSFDKGDVKAKFSSHSGTIKYYPSDDDSFFMAVTQSKIEEVDNPSSTVRTVVKSWSLSTTGTWSPPVRKLEKGIEVMETTFTSSHQFNHPGKTLFTLKAKLYKGEANINQGSEVLKVPKNSILYTVEISNWPTFTKPSNKLEYVISFSSKGDTAIPTVKKDNVIKMSTGTFKLPKTALLKKSTETKNVPLVSTSLKKVNGESLATISFASFSPTDKLTFESVMTVASSATQFGINFGLTVILLVFAFMFLL